ncbi:hypothetical protein CPB85DRAFT_1180770, partial [Mucidula mucida]
IWFGQDDPRNESLRLPEALGKLSNQLGEITRAYRASVIADKTEDLTMLSDSMTMISAITDHLQNNEDNGWIGVADQTAHKALVASLRERTGMTYLQWVKGHSGIAGNEEADKLATKGLTKEKADRVEFEMNPLFSITGAKLKTITQATAYKAI